MEDVKEKRMCPCSLSEGVFSALKETYKSIKGHLDEKDLHGIICDVLSVPPITSVLRVNTTKEEITAARDSLQSLLDIKFADEKKRYIVSLHEKIPDILLVKPVSEKCEITPLTEEVIVGELCGVAVLRGANVFAPGVMGAPIGMKKGDTVSVYADLDAQCRKGFTKIYDGRKHFVGNGRAVMSRAELFKDSNSSLKGVAIEMASSLFGLPSFEELDHELYFAQNLPSLLVGHNLDLAPGDLVLDMCAAPGGKTTHVATLLENRGQVFAIDKSKSKVKKMKMNCSQKKLNNVCCFAFDSTILCNETGEITKPPFPPEAFDKIILDPPCSALGQRPQLQCNMTSAELESFPVYQRKLFRQAVKLLKPGGLLVYSTCTLTISENENQVAWALKNFSEIQLLPQDLHLGRAGIPGHDLDDINCKLVQRFDPSLNAITKKLENINISSSVDEDTIGFFIAKFRKKEITAT